MVLAEGAAQRQLHAEAAAVRDKVYGRTAVVRGVIELTNVCRVNCDYCPMRRDNTRQNASYMLQAAEILAAAREIQESGINVLVLQGGEIPQTTDVVAAVLPKIRELFEDRVEILLGLGIKSESEYRLLRTCGADTYILKHETADPDLHYQVRGESLEGRLGAIRTLLRLGYRVGTGCIVGLSGQTAQSLVEDMLLADTLNVHMCSASPFVPTGDTPLEHAAPGSISRTLNVIAAMRLLNPHWLIPSVSALEQQSTGAQGAGFRAGANVITVNFTPRNQRQDYLIYGAKRHVVSPEHVYRQLNSAGLSARGSMWVGA